MVDITDIKRGSVVDILVVIILGGLGLYLALALSNAITTTVNQILPPADVVAASWISFAVAVLIVAVLVAIIIYFYNR